MGLGGLSLGSDGDSGSPSSSGGGDSAGPSPPPPHPVQILPHLYLGGARDAADHEALARLGIRYVLNVTPNLPNLFAEHGGFHYKQIPISDHWSQNLARFFPEAIAFIGECPPLPETYPFPQAISFISKAPQSFPSTGHRSSPAPPPH